jgi:SAM-dependent methyltransferase
MEDDYRAMAGEAEWRKRGELFDQVAAYYDEVRPKYPARLFDDLLAAADAGAHPEVLEIGPGTGQATLSLLERGCSVVAIEPGPQLAARLRANVREFSDATIIVGKFEEVELTPGNFDIVTAATAFHWIDPDVRYRKSHEVLRAGGVIAIIELIQVKGAEQPDFFEAAHPIYPKYRDDEQDRWTEAPDAGSVRPRELGAIEASGLFEPIGVYRYRWDQTYTTEQYAKLLRTYSNTLAMDVPAREGMISEICQLIDARFGGRIVRPAVVTLTVARKR